MHQTYFVERLLGIDGIVDSELTNQSRVDRARERW